MLTLSRLVTILICVSTAFVKQHSVIDIICGIILSFCMNVLWNHRIVLFKRSRMCYDCFIKMIYRR
jgi:hypothetical protein